MTLGTQTRPFRNEQTVVDRGLDSVIERCDEGPSSHLLAKIGQDRYKRLMSHRLGLAANAPGSKIVWAIDDERPVGFAVATASLWDTAHLGFDCIHLDLMMESRAADADYRVGRRLIQNVLQECAGTGDHVSLRVNGEQIAILHALEDEGFNTTDTLLTFVADPPFQLPSKKLAATIRSCRTDDIDKVRTVAQSAFALGRWHSDRRIPGKIAGNVYSSWAEACCRDDVDHVTFVAEEAGRVTGFVSVKLDADVESLLGLKIGVIELIATSQDARRSGVGTALVAASLSWFQDQRVDTVHVGTQSTNTAACRLYERCGFTIAASSYSLTRWLDDE
jgi:dTDP-4-amino-4,6-dideoxy-D-galactose acyltransferase